MSIERICFVSLPAYGFFNPGSYDRTGGGGAKRQIHLLSQELTDQFDIHVVVGDYGQPETEIRDGVTLHRAYTPNEGRAPVQLYKLFQAMRTADADCYIYRGGPRKAAITARLATVLRRDWVYNVASDDHLEAGYSRCNPLIRREFRRGLQNARAIISQTSHQQRVLEQRFRVGSTVVPNGYTLPDSDPPAEREFILWVGRLEPDQNRPELYLDCAESLPDIPFKLIGVPNDSAYHRKIRTRAETIPNLDFVGSVPPTEIHDYYRRAIALVSTSAYEGFPNVFLEAWRQATPVVSLDVDPARYLDADLYTGYSDGEFDNLVAEIDRLATESEFRCEVGHDLHEFFKRQYAIDAVAKQYAAALDPTG